MKYYKFTNPDGSIGFCRGDSSDFIRNAPGITDFVECDMEEFMGANPIKAQD